MQDSVLRGNTVSHAGALAPPINDPQFNQPMPFNFDGTANRVLTISGAPWFVARDVALLLGYASRGWRFAPIARGV